MAEKKERMSYSEAEAKDANRDPITGAPGSHPVGTGVGAASGAATGALVGAAAGPIGAAVGLVAGGVIGGYSGKGIAEAIDPTYEDDYWAVNYTSRPYVRKDSSFENYRAAYRTGYEGYSRYPEKSYADVESDLRRDYVRIRGNANLNWEEAKQAARDAWFRVESEKTRNREDAKR